MPKHVVPADGWNKTNLVPGSQPGTFRSRKAVYKIANGNKYYPVGGSYTYRSQIDDVVRTYTVSTSSGFSTTLSGTDEAAATTQTDGIIMSAGRPEIVTWALVNGVIFCTSPSFSTQYAYQGGNMWEAASEDDPDDDYTTIPIPRGICVEWAGRLVISNDDVIHIADPRNPFRFISTNVLASTGGSIRGMYSVEGTLIICTTNGAWGLAQEYGLRRDVKDSWQKLSSYKCLEYGQTVEYNGIIWGVTQEGITAVTPSGANVDVNQSSGVRWHGERFSSPNWRTEGRLVQLGGAGIGLVTSARNALFALMPEERFGSWWYSDASVDYFNVRSVGWDSSGDLVFYHNSSTGGSQVFKLIGNRSLREPTVYASLSGSTREHNVEASPVMRKVHVASDLAGDGSAFLAVQSMALQSKTPPARGIVFGTSEWADGTKYQETEVRSRALHTNFRSDDHEIEVGVTEADAVLRSELVVEFHGVGKHRDTN